MIFPINSSFSNSARTETFEKEITFPKQHVDEPASLSRYKFSLITSLRTAWNYLVSLIIKCLSIFKTNINPEPVKKGASPVSVRDESDPSLYDFNQRTEKEAHKQKGNLDDSKGIEQKRRMRPYAQDDEGIPIEPIFIKDSEIVDKSRIVKSITHREKEFNWTITVNYSKHGKAIMQQRTPDGSLETAKGMLALDQGIPLDIKRLSGKKSDMPPTAMVFIENRLSLLKTLQALIKKNGSAIVKVNGPIGKHHVVVDDISPDFKNIRIRDPFHGWEITLEESVFYAMWIKEETVCQIDQRYQRLSPAEAREIESEIGWESAMLNAIKVLYRRENRNKPVAIVIEGASKTLCLEIRNSVFYACYFKENTLYILNNQGSRYKIVVSDEEKLKRIEKYKEKKIDLSLIKGIRPNTNINV